jgi:hypothetical protein
MRNPVTVVNAGHGLLTTAGMDLVLGIRSLNAKVGRTMRSKKHATGAKQEAVFSL